MSDTLIIDENADNGKKPQEPRQEQQSTRSRDLDRDEDVRNERRNRNDRDGRSSDYDDDRRERRGERRAWNMGSLARHANRPQLSGVSDKALGILIETFKDAKAFDNPNIDEEIQQSRFQVLPFTGNGSNRSQPSLLVCLPMKKRDVCLVYILVIEQPGVATTRTQVSRGESFDALVLPEHRLTDKYIGGVQAQAKGLGCNRVVCIGSQVILSSVISDVADKENTIAVARIFDNAINALCGYRQNLVDAVTGNRKSEYRLTPDTVEKGDRLECTIEYNQPFGQDTSGIPIRSDALLTVYYSERSEEEDDEDLYNRIPLVESRLSLDLFIEDDERDRERARLSRRSRSRRRDDDEVEAIMQPVININSIASVDNYPYSLELVALALGNIALLSNDYRFTNMFRPRKTIGGRFKPVFNIGDLAWLLPDLDDDQRQQIQDMMTPNIDDQDYAAFVDEAVKPEPAFGMLIPSASENSWALSIFEKIANADGSLQRQEVDDLVTKLYDAFDTVTDGEFRPAYRELNDGKMPKPVNAVGTRGLIGTWTDPDTNQLRPLSEWNVPAYLSRTGGKDIDRVRDFQLTFEPNRHTVDYNLADRYGMLTKIAPEVRVVQTAEQLVFQRHLLAALASALDTARMSSHIAAGDTLTGRRSVGNRAFRDAATSDAGISRRSNRRERDSRVNHRFLGGNDY